MRPFPSLSDLHPVLVLLPALTVTGILRFGGTGSRKIIRIDFPMITNDRPVIHLENAAKSCETLRCVGEQCEAVRVDRAKSGSNKGFLRVLLSTGCRFASYFEVLTRAREPIDACSISAPAGQVEKKCPVSRA